MDKIVEIVEIGLQNGETLAQNRDGEYVLQRWVSMASEKPKKEEVITIVNSGVRKKKCKKNNRFCVRFDVVIEFNF